MFASSEGPDEIAQACMGLFALICDKSDNFMNWPICTNAGNNLQLLLLMTPFARVYFRETSPMRVSSEGAGEIAQVCLSLYCSHIR